MVARSTVLLVALAVAVSGCQQPEGATIDPSPVPGVKIETRVNETAGAILGLAVDVEKVPLANVTVALGEGASVRTTTSSLAGEFGFNDIEPGSYKLFAQRLGYRSAATKVDVVAGEVTQVRLELAALVTGPAFPTEVRLYNVETGGGWFQVPYSQAQPFLPEGFSAKPHVLAETNGQTAEIAFYITKYQNGSLDGAELAEGYWSFVVLSVTPPEDHSSSGATVQFIPIASHASDPQIAFLLSTWGTKTDQGTMTFSRTGAGEQANQFTAALKSATGNFALTVGNAGEEGALTGGAISVRVFGITEQVVKSYVDIRISSILYSITGAARVEASGLPLMPQAVAGEGYVQWGAGGSQIMEFEAAETPS